MGMMGMVSMMNNPAKKQLAAGSPLPRFLRRTRSFAMQST
jgi:hypothetical protein